MKGNKQRPSTEAESEVWETRRKQKRKAGSRKVESYNRSAAERREGEEKERQIGKLSSQSLRVKGTKETGS